MKTRIRGFVLAAGYGTRLRPLTLFLPKPLLPVGPQPVIGHTLRELSRAGCEAAAVNLHHLPDAVRGVLGESWHGLPLVYSHEEEIQGTYGALYPQRDFLRKADLVVLVNGDTFCRWPLKRLIRRHLASGADATLLLHRRAPQAALGGGVGVSDGRVTALRDQTFGEVKRRHIFAGAHILSRHLLERLTAGPGDIISELYMPLIADGGHVGAVVTRGNWHDLGTAERYLESNLEWTRGRFTRGRLGRRTTSLSPLAEVHPSASVQGSVLAAGVRVGANANVESSVLLANATVAEGSHIERSILGPGVQMPASAKIDGRMINRSHIGHQTGPGESMMGDLIYTPLALEADA